MYYLKLKFQFHKGTIRTKGGDPEEFKQMNFNSIKVRLEPADVKSEDIHTVISVP